MPAVAIIGAGPSGCFVAQALLKLRPDARITILDALPVPYGLVRYGVAADHQGTKAITRQFDRLFERQGVAFAGNVRLGRDVTLEALQASFDAVVLATGLHDDRLLGIPGEALAGVHGSGVVTRGWNGWPDAAAPALGPRVVVVGAGNVALDVARLLAKTGAECAGSDLGCDPGAGVTEITVVGRSPAALAKFDAVMLREFGHLADCAIAVEGLAGDGPLVEVLRGLDGHAPAGATRRLTFRFGLTPLRIEGDDRVERIVFDDGTALDCDSIVTAIGFQGDDQPAAGPDGWIAAGLYAAGWRKRGPRGTIPENRADAQAVAARIAADLPAASDRPGLMATGAIGFDGWKRVDAAETAAAPAGRTRAKIATLAGLLAQAKGESP